MGLESASFIDQLVASNPTTGDPVAEGDNHIRLIKSVLQSQFTGLGAAAVTVTAAQLNAVTAKLTSFNGRTTPAVVPTEGDYTLTLLGDVAIAAPAALNALAYNGVNWQNLRGSALTNATSFQYDGYAGTVTDSIWFTNARRNTVPAAVGTVKNTGAGGIGWTFTAAQACVAQINLQCVVTLLGALSAQSAIGYFSGAPTAAIPAAGVNRLAFAQQTLPDDGLNDTMTLSTSAGIAMQTGDQLALYWDATSVPAQVTMTGIITAL